jgi:hypothetical protein
MRKKAQSIANEFADNLRTKLVAGAPTSSNAVAANNRGQSE